MLVLKLQHEIQRNQNRFYDRRKAKRQGFARHKTAQSKVIRFRQEIDTYGDY